MLLISFSDAYSRTIIENIEVEVTNIDYTTNTIEYVDKDSVISLKLDPNVIVDGYYDSNSNAIALKKIKLNKKYFLRIINENYVDDNNNEKSYNYVTAISTVLYDKLF